ncbi:acyltransferase family protein [Zunongwangia sp. F363]|uniref:Acyltransferase family protein n=1 Tax=Autumnicola tepida TaxID=3075595 RepID=A0ABU3C8Y9_9FLAO|nr:acyltransferase family protein [Zunongwangia sp. F363]MDT0642804.1 acyltransferase family protein [Zunongwangia sp. F363]
MKTQRRYDIDWLRVMAIGLLLIYHIAIIFQPWAMFIGFIRSDELMEGLWKPMSMLNVWRIPLLFYVSGMGVYFAIQKRNWKELLLERGKRILLPYIFGIIAIVPLHFLIFQEYYNLSLGYYAHQGHLWFLGNIFAYVLLMLPLFFYLKKIKNSRFMKGLSSLMKNPAGPLSVSILFVVETILVRPQVFEMYAQTWHGFFLGLMAFFFGFLFVYIGQAFWQTVLKWKWLYFGLAICFYIIRLTLFNMEAPGYLMALESNCWIFTVFGFGYKYLNKPGRILSYLSQAAYPVYIIHMFVLYAGALFILPLEIPVLLKFILISLFTFLVCFLIYEFILRRINILRPLFGLKWMYKNDEKKAEQLSEPVQPN